jgi:hypothetical protein
MSKFFSDAFFNGELTAKKSIVLVNPDAPSLKLTISNIATGRHRITGAYGSEYIEFGEGGNSLTLNANEIYYRSTNNVFSPNAKIISSGTGGLTFQTSNFYQQGDTRYGFQFYGDFTAAIASSPSVLGLVRFNPVIQTSVGVIDGSILHITPTINTTGGTTNWSAIYYNPTVTGIVGLDHYFINASTGKVKFGDLVGSGNRMVVADATGLLTTQGIPTGTITGTGTSGQVAFWNGTSSQTGDNGLFWDNTNKRLNIGNPVGFNGRINLPSDATLNWSGGAQQGIRGWSGRIGIVFGTTVQNVFYGGSLGINNGSSNPTANLDVNGTGRIRTGVSLADTSGNVQIGTLTDAGFRLDVNGTARIQSNLTVTATNATGDFATIDGSNIIRRRTAAQVLSDIGAQGALTLTTTGTSGVSTLIGNTLNIPNYSTDLTGYVPYSGATQNVNLGEFGLTAGFVGVDLTPIGTPSVPGTMFWSVDDETVDLVMDAAVTQKIGQETFYLVKNQTGAPIPKGTVVRADGTVGTSGRILIAPFLANGTVPSKFCIGVTAETIADGADGFVTAFGKIRQINTASFPNGTVLYASPTSAGGFTATAPQAPNNIVTVAIVINSSTSNGAIFVRPTFSSNINEDEGVKIISPVANEGLFYNGGYWVNKTVAAALGYTPIGGTGTAGQVTYWTGTNTQVGSANFTWDNTISKLTVNGDTHIAGVATFGNGLRFDFDQATRIFNGNRIGYQSNDNTMQHWFANQIGSALSGATSSLVTFQAANGGVTLTPGLAIASFLGDNNQEVLRVQSDGYVKAPFHMTVGTSTPNAQTRLTVMGSQTFSKSIVLDSTWNFQTSWAMRNGVFSTEFNLGGSTKSVNEGGPGSLQISTYNATTNTFRYPITFFANSNVSFGGNLGSVPADNGSTVQVNGSVQSSSLSGSGTRMVVASAGGVLGVQAIPTVSLQGAVDNDKNTSGSLAVGTTIVKSVSATTYSGVFFDYVVKNGTNVRVGSVVAITNGASIEFYETLSNDIGTTTGLTFTVTLGSGNMNLNAVAAGTGFTVIVSTRAI